MRWKRSASARCVAAVVPDALDGPKGVGMLAAQQALLERPAEAQRASPVRNATVPGVVERLAVADPAPGRARGVHREGADAAAQRTRDPPLKGHHDPPVVDVALIAVEELVGALADLDHDGPRFAGQARDEVLRDGCPVRERLVLMEHELGHELAHGALVDEHLVMVGAEAPRHRTRVTELVVARVSSWCGRVRTHRQVGQLGHERDVGR